MVLPALPPDLIRHVLLVSADRTRSFFLEDEAEAIRGGYNLLLKACLVSVEWNVCDNSFCLPI